LVTVEALPDGLREAGHHHREFFQFFDEWDHLFGCQRADLARDVALRPQLGGRSAGDSQEADEVLSAALAPSAMFEAIDNPDRCIWSRRENNRDSLSNSKMLTDN
jgi:hypothetical protein